MTGGPCLALFPRRHDKVLINHQSVFSMISFVDENVGVQFGRPDLLSCLHAACGCDADDNIFSSHNKCKECRNVYQWINAISCYALCMTSKTTIICKPRYMKISVDGHNVERIGDEWCQQEITIRAGSKITLSYCQHSLEFEAINLLKINTSERLGLLPEISRKLGLLPGTHFIESNEKQPKNQQSPQQQHCQRKLTRIPKSTSIFSHKIALSAQGETELSQPLFCTQENLSPYRHSASKVTTPSTVSKEVKRQNSEPKLSINKTTDSSVTSSTSTKQKPATVEKKSEIAQRSASLTESGIFKSRTNKVPVVDFIVTGVNNNKRRKVSFPKTTQEKDQRLSTNRDGNFKFKIYFVKWGPRLPSFLVRQYEEKMKKLGAQIVDHYRKANHIVVDKHITWDQLAKHPDINTEVEPLKAFLDCNNIVLPTVDWVIHIQNAILRKPAKVEEWCISIYDTRKRRSDPLNPAALKKKKARKFENNLKISEKFKELSELYQECQLDASDIWRAYSFRINAGRITRIPFEVSDDPVSLGKLKEITGFGSGSCLEIVEEFFREGDVRRLKILKATPQRVAMRNMTSIWGVGKVKGSELVKLECTTIDDVRRKLRKKILLPLERNQMVGVECYEDILERFTRVEAENIGTIVRGTCNIVFPGVEVTIMGSYRRGKETLGDVDVHITHKDFKEKVPADALGKIIDALWNRDHIAFHLTFLYGMQTGLSDSDYQKRTTNIPKDAWRTTKSMGPPKHLKAEKSSSSYMGVFNSPLVRGKRRRVDIKIYPYRERIFAALYFTGNGFFNRSMRLWARSFGWQLNDHGLFVRDTPQRVMEAEDEKVVFEKLQLVYKKAQERDAFDALEPIDGYFDEPPPNKTDDEMKESHVWIK